MHQPALPDFEGMCKNIIKSLLPTAPAQPANRRGAQVTLPRFDGQGSFEKWKQDLELHFIYLNWAKEDPQRAAVIPTLLDDYAKFHYLKFPPDSLTSYELIMTQLDALFATSRKPLSVKRNYMNRHKKHSETVREFSAIILQRFSECNPPLETQIHIYCDMLLPELSAEIKDDEYDSIDQLVQCAEKAEHRLKLRKEAQLSVNNVKYSRDRSRGRDRQRSNGSNYRSQSRQGHRSQSNYRGQSRARSHSRPAKQSDQRDRSFSRPHPSDNTQRSKSTHADRRPYSSERSSQRQNRSARHSINDISHDKDLN